MDRDVPAQPRALYLESTNRCNLGCTTCVRTYDPKEADQDLTVAGQIAILDQVPGLERVVLHGIGEPLLNPELPELVRSVKARGAHAVFNSNGTLLTARKARALIDAALDEYRLSLDAATPETYLKIRGADMFAQIVENVRRMQAMKDEMGVTLPKVSVWITVMKDNVGELPALVDVALSMQVDEIHLQRLVYFGQGMAVEAQSVYRELDDDVANVIAEAAVRCQEAGISLHASGGIPGSEFADAAHTAGTEARPWSHCQRPWSLSYITAHGNVLPCCISPWVAERYEDIILGNIHENSLAEIWHGEAYTTFREQLLSDVPPAVCRQCGVGWSL